MADDKILFDLDVNNESFIKGVSQAKNSLNTLTDTKSFEGLIGVIESAGPTLAILATAFLAAKTALDWTVEGEKIERIEKQFETLSTAAGISGEKLKAGLTASSQGLVTDALEVANKAMLVLGESASRLPEVMDLAAKATKVFGGTLTGNFENLSQAIEMQMPRALKHYGIMVDTTRAYAEYAKKLGIAANALTDQEKKQAFLNAVLEQSKKQFKDVGKDLDDTTASITRIKTSLKEMMEIVYLAFEKTFGPTIKKIAVSISGLSQILKTELGENLKGAATGASATEIELKKLDETHKKYLETVKFAKSLRGVLGVSPDDVAAENAALQKENDTYLKKSEELKGLIAKQKEELSKTSGVGPETKAPEAHGDQEQLAKNQAKFYSELTTLRMKSNQEAMNMATSEEEVLRLSQERKLLIQQEATAKINTIKTSSEMDDRQKSLLIEQEKIAMNQRIVQNEEEKEKQIMASLDRLAEKNKYTTEGWAASWAMASRKAAAEQNNFKMAAERAQLSFVSNATSALQAFGAGQKTAGEAAKGFVFGMLADEAEARGKLLLLASIWPPNPVGLGAGAGLIALSGFLRAQASGASSSGIGGGGGGGGGAAAAGGQSGQSPSLTQDQFKKSVTVQIQGNYFETNESRQRLLDIIRQETDATDFKYTQVKA